MHVKYVDNSDIKLGLTIGKIYKPLTVDNEFYYIKSENGVHCYYAKERFVVVDEKEERLKKYTKRIEKAFKTRKILQPKILIDLDGVIFNWEKSFIKVYKKYGGDKSITNLKEYDVSNLPNPYAVRMALEHVNRMEHEIISTEFVGFLKANEDVLDYKFVTARDTGFGTTFKYIVKEMGFDIKKLMMIPDKNFVFSLFDFVIEDNPNLPQEVLEKSFIIEHKYNKEVEDVAKHYGNHKKLINILKGMI